MTPEMISFTSQIVEALALAWLAILFSVYLSGLVQRMDAQIFGAQQADLHE